MSVRASREDANANAFHALHEIAIAVGGVLEPAELGRLVGERARGLVGADSAGLRLWDEEAHRLVALYSSDPFIEERRGGALGRLGTSLVAFERKEPVVVQDYQAWTRSLSEAVDRGMRAAITVPLLSAGRAIGTLGVRYYRPHTCSENEVRLLTLLAAQVAPAFDAARSFAESERQRREAAGLAALMREAASELNVERQIALIGERACELVGADYAGVALYEPDGTRAWRGVHGTRTEAWRVPRQRRGKGRSSQALAARRTVIAEHLGEGAGSDQSPLSLHAAEGARTVLATPLIAGDQALGSLTLAWRTDVHPSPQQVRLAETIAAHTASVLDRNRATETARLAAARVLYEATAIHLVDGLAIADADQRVQFWNPSLEAIVGIPAADAVGRSLLEVEAPVLARTADPEAACISELQALRAVREGNLWRTEIHLLGTPPRDLEILYFPVPLPEGRPGIGKLVRDVTRERELARMKDEMVSVVSHELRTPMAALVGFAELLLTREWPEAQRREFLETMLKEGRRLSVLLDEFLDVRRLESTGVALARQPTDLAALLEMAGAVVRGDTAHPVRLVVAPDLPPVHANPARVQQVLANLLSNAAKYSPNGGEIIVTAREDGALVEVAVRDQGLGFPASALPHLFEDFYRVESAEAPLIGGTGLGLAICKRIVEAHRGRIWAESRGPNQGSTFRFTLPVAELVGPPAEGAAPPTSTS